MIKSCSSGVTPAVFVLTVDTLSALAPLEFGNEF
jgi:hypothetical protein